MIDFYIHTSNDINIIDIEEVNINILFTIFTKNPDVTIYVQDFGRIVGIITFGDFKRHFIEGTELINRRFSKVFDENMHEIKKIFSKSSNILSIPQIDEEGNIVKEYYRVRDKKVKYKISYEIIQDICNELSMLDVSLDEWYVIIDDEYEYEYFKLLGQNNKLELISATDIEKLLCCLKRKNKRIVDLANSSFGVRKLLYDKYDIKKLMVLDAGGERMFERNVREKGKLFNNIAISNNSGYLKKIFSNKAVEMLDLKKCKWNFTEQCYEYIGNYDKEIECIFMLFCFLTKPYIIVNKKLVPIIANTYLDIHTEKRATMIDLYTNIIARFNETGIKYILINEPDAEYEDLKKHLSEDIYQRMKIDGYAKKNRAKIVGLPEDILKEEIIFRRIEIKNGFKQISDQKGQYYNYINGERYTVGNPTNYDNKIFLHGPCMVAGYYVTDENTIGSCLRKKVSNKYYIKNKGSHFAEINFMIRNDIYKKGDIVVIMICYADLFIKNGLVVHSIIDAYKKIEHLENYVLDQLIHCGKEVTKLVSDEIYGILEKEELLTLDENISLQSPAIIFGEAYDRVDIPDGMKEWLIKVKKYKVEGASNAGAIVMNCNPFTLGHRYLIETASSQVDVLYIFVLEEDKSFFKFNDRIELVRQGTKDLENVVVLPSGRYVISTETLPGYFDKEKNPYAELDATEDLEIFSQVIAKEFDIKVRFAGEEPNDPFTRKYNDYMRRLLPKNGVEFIEIPRKECGNQAISASLVRKHLKERNFDEIRGLVPKSTLEFLENKYK